MKETNQNRSKFSLWMQAIRPFSLTATLIPIIFGAIFTLGFYNGPVNWWLIIIIALGGPFFQISGNLFSEYYDFKHQVDRPETYGSSRILVDGLMKPSSIFWGAVFSLVLLIIFGAILIYFRGTEMLLIGLIGLIGSYIYTFLKYHAFGDLQIFLCFGPLMIFGTFFALTGSNSLLWEIAFTSLPIGFLVTAILHANNTRDIKHDGEAKINTFASLIGVKTSIYYYDFLLIGAFIAIIIFILLKLLPIWTLFVFLSFPMALKHIKLMNNASVDNPKAIVMLDVMTAQLHMLFGLLLSIGILIGFLVK